MHIPSCFIFPQTPASKLQFKAVFIWDKSAPRARRGSKVQWLRGQTLGSVRLAFRCLLLYVSDLSLVDKGVSDSQVFCVYA